MIVSGPDIAHAQLIAKQLSSGAVRLATLNGKHVLISTTPTVRNQQVQQATYKEQAVITRRQQQQACEIFVQQYLKREAMILIEKPPPKFLAANTDRMKKDIIEELKEMFTKQYDKKIKRLQFEIQDLKKEIQDLKKKEHNSEIGSLKKQENIISRTPTKRNHEVLEVSSTVPSSKKPKYVVLNHQCTLCGKSFAKEQTLKNHIGKKHKETNSKKQNGHGNKKEFVGGCCICTDENGYAENPLIFCDSQGCDVVVHQACYGIVQVPSGPWFCRKCESQERGAHVRCMLCPNRVGALKRTDTNNWAHVICALYIPEVRFQNVSTMEPIVLGLVPPERYGNVCTYSLILFIFLISFCCDFTDFFFSYAICVHNKDVKIKQRLEPLCNVTNQVVNKIFM